MKMHGLNMVVCGVAALLLAGDVSSQTASTTVKVRQLRGRKLKTPDYNVRGVSGGGGVRSRNWYRIECSYETSKEWIDELQFTYYAILKGSGGSSGRTAYRLLTGSVTNVDIAKGRHESVMFVHPSQLERHGDVEAVAVMIKANGVNVATETYPNSRTRWWEQYPAQGALLNRLQSAFAFYNYDNYEMIKLGARP